MTQECGILSRPFITVIIQAFKRKEFIENAIRSVLNQTLDKQKYEILVIKAFRDQKIDALIKRYKIKSVYNPSKKEGIRLISALNRVRGQIIAFLDDDDEFEVDKLKFVYKYFKENPNLSFYHNLFNIIDENSKKATNINDYNLNYYSINMINKSNLSDAIHKLHILTNSSSIAIKKNVLIKNIKELKKIGVTLDVFLLLIALLEKKEILADNKILTGYRIHRIGKVTQGKLKTFDDFCAHRVKSTRNIYKETERLYKIAYNNDLESLFKETFIETKLYYNIFNTKIKPNAKISFNEYITFLNNRHFSKSSISLVFQCLISHYFKKYILKLIYKHEVEIYENTILQHI